MLFLHIDNEVDFALGCTVKELMVIAVTGFMLGAFLGITLLAILFNMPQNRLLILGLLCAVTLGSLITLILSTLVKQAKRNKPPYMYKQKLRIWAQNHHLVKSQICTRSGYWSA